MYKIDRPACFLMLSKYALFVQLKNIDSEFVDLNKITKETNDERLPALIKFIHKENKKKLQCNT